MADVEIAVRLRREARMYASGILPVLEIFIDDLPNEIRSYSSVVVSDSAFMFSAVVI